MQKDELIQLHAFLLHLKNSVELQYHLTDDYFFSDYEKLNVQPQQLFKPKKDQQHAIFALCKGLSKLFNMDVPF